MSDYTKDWTFTKLDNIDSIDAADFEGIEEEFALVLTALNSKADKAGYTLTGDQVCNNDVALQWKNAGGTGYDAITVAAGDDLQIGNSNAAAFDDVVIHVAGAASAVTIQETTGHVGIGDTTPDYPLTVYNSSATVLGWLHKEGTACELRVEDDNAYASIRTQANGTLVISADAGNGAANTAIQFLTDGQVRCVIDDEGIFQVENIAGTPTGTPAGGVYYNTTTNKLRVYVSGTGWVDLN